MTVSAPPEMPAAIEAAATAAIATTEHELQELRTELEQANAALARAEEELRSQRVTAAVAAPGAAPSAESTAVEARRADVQGLEAAIAEHEQLLGDLGERQAQARVARFDVELEALREQWDPALEQARDAAMALLVRVRRLDALVAEDYRLWNQRCTALKLPHAERREAPRIGQVVVEPAAGLVEKLAHGYHWELLISRGEAQPWRPGHPAPELPPLAEHT